MSEKFTKGPWTIEHDREFDECIIYAEREEDRVVICEVGTYVTVSDKDHSIDLKQIKANAKLLADAWQLPNLRMENAELKAINKEMLDVLKASEELQGDVLMEVSTSQRIFNAVVEYNEKLNKVIRKARGGTE